jgi:hypothetical protein
VIKSPVILIAIAILDIHLRVRTGRVPAMPRVFGIGVRPSLRYHKARIAISRVEIVYCHTTI